MCYCMHPRPLHCHNMMHYYTYMSDPSFTVESVCSVMSSPKWKEVWSTLIPEPRLDKIERECSGLEERNNACAVVYASHRNASWKDLAASLYTWNHLGVLKNVTRLLPPKGLIAQSLWHAGYKDYDYYYYYPAHMHQG